MCDAEDRENIMRDIGDLGKEQRRMAHENIKLTARVRTLESTVSSQQITIHHLADGLRPCV